MTESLLHIVKLVLYASFDLLTGKAISVGLVVAGAAIVSSWVMTWLLPRLSEGLFRRIGYGAMVVSGLSLFTGVGNRLLAQNGVQISYAPISDGAETKVQWRQSPVIVLEFEFDEGFEFEHTVSLADLPPDKQAQVKKLSAGADRVVLEEVFGIGKHYYEAYVFRGRKLEKSDV